MTAVLLCTRVTVTAWSVAHALAEGRAVAIDTRPGGGTDTRWAEDRPEKRKR